MEDDGIIPLRRESLTVIIGVPKPRRSDGDSDVET